MSKFTTITFTIENKVTYISLLSVLYMLIVILMCCSDQDTIEPETPYPQDVTLTITYFDKPSETCIFSYFNLYGPVTTVEEGCSKAIFPPRCGVKSIKVASDFVKLRCY